VAVLVSGQPRRDVDGLRLIADVPAAFRQAALLRRSEENLSGYAQTLDLLAVLQGKERFLETAFTMCNEITARLGCHQVALGWLRGRYVDLVALSHREKFDAKMEAAQHIAAAMEEALDQDEEVVWPAIDDAQVTRDHARCAEALRTVNLATIPLRVGRRLIGALWLERAELSFGEKELRVLRVAADQIAEPLWHLRRRDRWWGARWKGEVEDALRRRWSLEHPWWKLGGLVAALSLAFALLVPLPYRVEAAFVIRPAAQSLLGPAFDGYLQRVEVTAGDRVEAGQVLFALDDATWRLQAAALTADASRHRAEAEEAQGRGEHARMRIARAQEEQALAELELVRHNLAGAVVRAPFPGMVVEDAELSERIGASVTRGDVLMRVAREHGLFAELDVPERDVDDVVAGAAGELAFASRPDDAFALKVKRIEPAAVAKEAGGVFPVRGEMVDTLPEWVRPGMTGVAKIEAGRRTAFSQLTQRFTDWLRLQLWW
jgi:biotin carboxyl carrier protein